MIRDFLARVTLWVVVCGCTVAAQTTPAKPPAPKAPASGAAQSPKGSAAAPSTGSVPVDPQGYTYDPDGRRDPFVSLLRSGGGNTRPTLGTRPPGLAGLSSSEVALKGTMQSRSGFVGLLQGVDNKTYIVKPGDKLLDGTIRSITANAMVILQQVNDPLSLQKEREVRKVLRQADEVK